MLTKFDDTPDYKRILVIKMSAMGDIVHALPALYALRAIFPKAHISWLAEPQFKDLLPGPPYLDETIVFYKNDLKKKTLGGKIKYLWNLRKELRAHHFDLVIDLQGLMKSTLVGILSGCDERVGYWELREGSSFFTKPIMGPNAKGHIIERYLDVIRHFGPVSKQLHYPLPDFSAQKEKMALDLKTQGLSGPMAAIFPGASWETKRWPIEKYAALVNLLAQQGLNVIIGGGSADTSLAQEIIKLCAPLKLFDLSGQTDILRLMALVSLASLALGSDSGPLHLATATNTPTVSLFGPNNGQRTGAYGPLSRNISSKAPCSPCFKRKCPKTFVCMEQIEVEQVFQTSQELLALAPPKPI
ncbi:MAG: lipopolysaccharide heptosyltransferase II [Deltaproteobacteria bacterium]|jgi:heptosyltransferase-1/heptosyltransferase-2|nr:lipopolysaccharide heptosyltransferase II [Deltaproteobacteria bacterium]